MAFHLQDTVTLNNGVKMPRFGLGVYKVQEGEEVIHAVKSAIRAGYRSIDTAALYNNEEGVGQAVREAMTENGLTRDQLFITSKVWNSEQGYEKTLQAFETSLNKLGLDYIDLFLVHWPVKGKYKDTWRALEKIYEEGKVRAIGVSNFQIHHLEDLLGEAKIVPAVNQVELHPLLSQKELLNYATGKGIYLEAWAPLGQGRVLDDETLKAIGSKYGKTPAQVILRWDLQVGIITIPKSVNEQRIIENADIFNFELSAEEIAQIDGLNKNQRFGPDPDTFDF
ncbi:aldo/keto reductase [Paenibacillus sp. D2_2]|uniref:aldo/keto reductase n=1 Tax=Paenibacillus sp. D2_2 TaxID=3073092 RepID=UPI002815AEA9|nr:aldo/keto reductase [Paenibacillus sp. D2_2]WMT39060.1 aldo/keto reductase [Paenibacillus sp. D2_2]